MARYIDADKIITDAIKERKFFIQSYDAFKQELVVKTIYKDLYEFIESQPTADVVEVKHGEWTKKVSDMWHCSLCLHPALLNGCEEDVLSNHCPFCGAKMDGEKK